MLVRKCDRCGKEMQSYWKVSNKYISVGKDKTGIVRNATEEVCDDCIKKYKLEEKESEINALKSKNEFLQRGFRAMSTCLSYQNAIIAILEKMRLRRNRNTYKLL